MSGVRILLGKARSSIRKAALVLSVTQLVLAMAPLVEKSSPTVQPHIEASGDLHFAHTEELCHACIAAKILSAAAPAHAAELPFPDESSATRTPSDGVAPAAPPEVSRSRAPPRTILA